MKKSLSKLLAIGMLAAGSEIVSGSDDLFSAIRSTSVYTSQSSGNASTAATGSRVTSLDELARLLRESDLEATVTEGKSVTTKKQLAPWEFPVLLTISSDEREIYVALGLSSVQDAAKIPAETLLNLLEANEKHPSAKFVFNRDRKRTEITGVLKNDAMTGLTLRDEINRLAMLARDTKDVWHLAATPESTPGANSSAIPVPETEPAPAQPAAPSSSAPATVLSLTGRWTAAKSSTEAFAAEFTSDGKFVLVHVNQGKQTRSSGTFVADSQTLTLNGESGLKLAGTLKAVSESEFQFSPTSSSGNPASLSFKRAK